MWSLKLPINILKMVWHKFKSWKLTIIEKFWMHVQCIIDINCTIIGFWIVTQPQQHLTHTEVALAWRLQIYCYGCGRNWYDFCEDQFLVTLVLCPLQQPHLGGKARHWLGAYHCHIRKLNSNDVYVIAARLNVKFIQ